MMHCDHFAAFFIQNWFKCKAIQLFAFIQIKFLLILGHFPLFPFHHFIKVLLVASNSVWSFHMPIVFLNIFLLFFFSESFSKRLIMLCPAVLFMTFFELEILCKAPSNFRVKDSYPFKQFPLSSI